MPMCGYKTVQFTETFERRALVLYKQRDPNRQVISEKFRSFDNFSAIVVLNAVGLRWIPQGACNCKAGWRIPIFQPQARQKFLVEFIRCPAGAETRIIKLN